MRRSAQWSRAVGSRALVCLAGALACAVGGLARAEGGGTDVETVFAATPEREPAGALLLYRQGLELVRAGQHSKALALFERARKLSPTWALPHLEIAVAHLVTDNDRQEIGRSLERAVQLGPDIPRAHYLYGLYLQESGQRIPAMREYVAALKLRPSMVDARYRLAGLYVEEGRQGEGLDQFRLVLEQRPSHLGAHRNLAVLYEQSGRLEEAESHLQAITWLFPDNAYHQANLGSFYKRIGWDAKAREAHRKADKLDPRDMRRLRPLLKSRN